jgi:hypothetical protein
MKNRHIWFSIHNSSFIVHHSSSPTEDTMNRGHLFALRQACAVIAACAMLAVLTATGRAADPPQKKDRAKAAGSTSKINEEYTAKIKEYTTEKYFLTELVDHLPASDKVPSPDKVLGYVVGTPNKLTYTKDMYRYYRELGRQRRAFGCSPRLNAPRKAANRCSW